MAQITNEAIVERIDGMKELFVSKLEQIHEQTLKTNGRVSALEIKSEKTNSKLDKFIGGFIVIDSVIAISLAILAIILK